jgi:hypothetical protein
MITPALWCYLTSLPFCLDCQASTSAHRYICEQDSGSFRSAPRSQTQTHHNHHNASTPSINERITFHMSAIKQINQYWSSQLNIYLSQLNAASVATYGVARAWFWVWLLDDDVVGPVVQHQVVLEHRDSFRKLPIGMTAISETSAGWELLLSYSPPSCLGMPPVSRGLNRKTWWDHDAMNIPFKCLGEKITEDEMERKKEFIPEEWAMGAFIYKSPAHRCFKNSKVHLAYEDHFRASNQSESLSRSHFQWELPVYVAVLGVLLAAAR